MSSIAHPRRTRERRLAGGAQLLPLLSEAGGPMSQRDLLQAAARRGLDREVVERWLDRAQEGGVVRVDSDPARPPSTASRLVELTPVGLAVAHEDRRSAAAERRRAYSSAAQIDASRSAGRR